MLLAEEADTLEHDLRPAARGIESPSEIHVLGLELSDADARATCTVLEGFQMPFSLDRAAAKGSELVTQVVHELLELLQGYEFRSFAV